LESINCNDWWRQSNFGGQSNESDCYIAPTLINMYDSLIMKRYSDLYCLYWILSDDIYTIVSDMKTIVFIRFTENKIFAEKIIQNYSLEEGV
jgi:aldehyde dehydrogenase (NAD+)